MKFHPFTYQKEAIEFILERDRAMIALGVGAGKTAIALQACYQMKYDYFEQYKTIVITSKYATENVWMQELKKWDEFQTIRGTVVVGTPKEKMRAVHKNADLYITNYDAVEWFLKYKLWNFDLIIIDEVSEFKNETTKRYEKIKSVCSKAKKIISLTSEPIQNELADLWSEVYLLDRGVRLERSRQEFVEKYFFRIQTSQGKGYYLEPKQGAKKAICKKISDICFVRNDENWRSRAGVISGEIYVDLNSIEYSKYCWMQDEMCIAMKKSGKIEVKNKIELSTKLFQMANGAVYDDSQKVICIHDRKLDALKEIFRLFPSKNILIAYWFLHDKKRIMSRYSEAKAIEQMKDIEEWNQNKIRIGLIHPSMGGSDIRLYKGGNVLVWFSLTWSLHLYQRMIWRMTSDFEQKLYVEHIVTRNTIDEKIYKGLKKKNINQQEMMNALLEEVKENGEPGH